MTFRAAKRIDWRRFRACILALAAFLCLNLGSRAEDRKVQKRVPPVYPELAKRMRIEGVVRIQATVAPDGTVTDAKATNGNKMLSLAAEEAVKKWKFVAGDAESTVPIDVSFDLSN
ncbi:MAG: energy transducer TonB [Silvibacterium sp.]|nr:energy transducer TonB [Silvibacterium sp.]